MSVTFHIPSALRAFTQGDGEIVISATPRDVREALHALFAVHPGVHDRVLTETGQVREHVNIFVGPESIRYTGGLTTPVPAGAEISIVPAVSGG